MDRLFDRIRPAKEFSGGFSEEQLEADLAELGICAGDTLMVHSSCRAIGKVDGGAETVINALKRRLTVRGLLVMPTHTWATVNDEHNIFEPAAEPSCTGLLGEMLLQCGGVRSLHPTYSVAAWGRDAEKFIKDEQYRETSCPRSGCMGRLLGRGAKLLFIGVDMSKSTFVRGIEEWNSVDSTDGELKTRYVVVPGGTMFIASVRPEITPEDDCSKNYIKLEKPLIRMGVAKEGLVGEARSIICPCEDMLNAVSRFLIFDHELFMTRRKIPESTVKSVARELGCKL